MRTYLVFSKEADAIPLAMKIEKEGHRVIVYINDLEERGVGEGLVEKAKLKDQIVDKNGSLDNSALSALLKETNPECVIFDMIGKGIGKAADIVRKERPVVGASLWGEVAELDRPYGIKVMKMAGINTPKTYPFKSLKEGLRFVEEQNKPFVYKPSDNMNAATTYVARETSDLIAMMEFYGEVGEFELQEKVEGIEISTEVWYNGKEVVNVNHTMEEKGFMEGGIGPKTGSMGSVVWNGKKSSKLYIEGIGKLEDTLRRVKYQGPIDLNTILTKDKLYGLEFTCRFGYDAIFTFNELLKDRLSDLLYGIATGVIKQVNMREGFAMGVCFAILPFPSPLEEYRKAAQEICKDKVIQGINKENIKHIWLGDVYKKGEQYLCAGVNGMLGVVSARWDTPGENPLREAKRRCYRTLSNLIIPDVMFRNDIGERVARDKTQLESWGWL